MGIAGNLGEAPVYPVYPVYPEYPETSADKWATMCYYELL